MSGSVPVLIFVFSAVLGSPRLDDASNSTVLDFDMGSSMNWYWHLVEPDSFTQPNSPGRDKRRNQLQKRLSSSQVHTKDEALRAAIGSHGAINKGVTPVVVGLYIMGEDVQHFAKQGDYIWIVRIVDQYLRVIQELAIHSDSRNVVKVMVGNQAPSENLPWPDEITPALNYKAYVGPMLGFPHSGFNATPKTVALLRHTVKELQVPSPIAAENAVKGERSEGYRPRTAYSLIRLGREVPSFARSNDFVWVVLVSRNGQITREIWVNSRTGASLQTWPPKAPQ